MSVSQALRGGLAVAMLVAVGGGCFPAQPTLAAAPGGSLGSSTPLEARLFPPYYGQVPFSVNRPAHVALFEIVPGSGVSLLYPTAGSGFTRVRENWIPLQYNSQRWLYASNRWQDPAAGQWSGFDYGYGMGYAPVSARSMGQTQSPRYLFLVASDEPISVGQFQHNLGGLRQFLGYNLYSSYQPYEVMERLAYALVPYANDENWVTDVFVDWGYDWGYAYTPGTSAVGASWVAMRCADGSVGAALWVPGWGYTSMTCAPWANGQQAPGEPDAGTPPAAGGQGRGRANGASEGGRGRTGDAEQASPRPQLQPQATPETRTRIAQLREEASLSQFGALVNQQVREGVELRHRADALMGTGPAGGRDASGRATSGGARRSGAGAANGAPRSREGGGSPSAQPRRGSTESGAAPRSRESAPQAQPRASTRAPESAPAPRSREATPAPAPAPAPPPPPPQSSSPRSRPPTSR